MALQTLVVSPAATHTATIIFVHGLGDTGHGWQPVAEMFKRDPAMAHVKWVLPHAPTIPITVNGGRSMPAWFDIAAFGGAVADDSDEAGKLRSARQLDELIAAEVELGIAPGRIVLGGFSQGGTMSLFTGLTSARKLAGVVVLSGRLALRDKFKEMASEHARSTPIFWGHGTADPLVRFELATAGREYFKTELQVKEEVGGLEFHSYTGLAHSTSEEELADLRTWLKKVLPE